MHATNQYRLLRILVALLGGSLLQVRAEQPAGDHLVPAESFFDSKDDEQTAYWKLLERKLFVTPGDMARFIQFPGPTGAETAVSLHRVTGKGDSYSITITQPSSSIWHTVPRHGEPQSIKEPPINVERCDAPVPQSTALAIRQVWLTMLRQVGPKPKSNAISVDGTIEIFTALAPDGKVLRGQSPPELVKGGNVSALVDVVNALIHYCDIPESERAEMARTIEKDASALLKAVSNGHRGRQTGIGVASKHLTFEEWFAAVSLARKMGGILSPDF